MTFRETSLAPRRRRWPAILVVFLVLGALGWSAAWFYGSGVLARTIEGWKAREAASGRNYACANQTIGGFPFGLELYCGETSATIAGATGEALALQTKAVRLSAALWHPTELRGEFTGPLTVAGIGGTTFAVAQWNAAHTVVHGSPTAPERVTAEVQQFRLNRSQDTLLTAERALSDARLTAGSVQANPVIELVLGLKAAASPNWHPAAAVPADVDVTAVLRGLKDLMPKPLPVRLRELQAAGGRIEIVKARIQQRDTVAVADGTLALSPAGRLTGTLNLTVANLEKFLPALGLEQMLSQEQASPQMNSAFGALDRLVPGLGNIARKNATPALAASVNLMGRPAELEGQRAVALPLRFDDGAVSLGPLKLGMVPALF